MNRQLTERIYYTGINDLKKELFENQWPLPYGVTYNSYIIKGDKTALIDTAAESFDEEYLLHIAEFNNGKPVDYLIVNHMEPDHSSLIPVITEKYPNIQIVTNAKAANMIKGYYNITENIKIIKEGESLDLGDGIHLNFYMIPMVHWPETMVTYCPEEKTVFSGDAFGSFGAIELGPTDADARIYLENKEKQIAFNCEKDVPTESNSTFEIFRNEMMRYYSNIVGKYGAMVQRALGKLNGLEIKRICSTHGPVWENEIDKVIDLYDKMSKYETENGVCIVYGSMYGNTEKAAVALADALKKRDIPYALHNLATQGASFAYRDVFKYNVIAAGSPTYNNDIFPPVLNFLHGVTARTIKNHKFVSFGSYTWAGGAVKKMNEMMEAGKLEIISDGNGFAQSFSSDKCDMDALADVIASKLN